MGWEHGFPHRVYGPDAALLRVADKPRTPNAIDAGCILCSCCDGHPWTAGLELYDIANFEGVF
jgi:hypothetical protein